MLLHIEDIPQLTDAPMENADLVGVLVGDGWYVAVCVGAIEPGVAVKVGVAVRVGVRVGVGVGVAVRVGVDVGVGV